MAGTASVIDGLEAWCDEHLGAPARRVLFRVVHLSTVVGVELTDGRAAVVKARPPDPRIAGCVAVHRIVWERGFPCPEPLAGPAPLGNLTATAEAYVPGGRQRARDAAAPAAFAGLLADLVAVAPTPGAVPPLDPAPPWAGWDHRGVGVWPPPDDLDADLNEHEGPGWLDAAAAAVRERLSAAGAGDPLVAHVDWESQNIRWMGARPQAVHDWDSVAARPEAAVAGVASAVFTADGSPGTSATVPESAAFLAAYGARRGPAAVDEDAWAAGLWVRAFNAKKRLVRSGDPEIELTEAECAERRRRAGL